MHHPSLYCFEVSGTSATLYMGPSLTPASAGAAMEACSALPAQVRHLRIDLRAIRTADLAAVAVISRALRPWRDARRGSSKVDLPQVPVSFAVLAG